MTRKSQYEQPLSNTHVLHGQSSTLVNCQPVESFILFGPKLIRSTLLHTKLGKPVLEVSTVALGKKKDNLLQLG